MFALADPDDDRTSGACNDDRIRIVFRDDRERISAFELGYRRAHRAKQIAESLPVVVDAMRDDFRVRLRGEGVAEARELLAQLLVVFDDAVVDDGDAVARDMRMRIALRGHAVRRPTRVSDAERTFDWRIEHRVLQRFDFADGPQAAQVARAVQHRDTGRIVAAVLQPA